MARTPIHPGEILADELEEIGLSAKRLADLLDVPPNRLYQILAGKRNLTADTALRLSRYFGTSADFWMNLQSACELDLARQRMARPSSASQSAARRCGKPGGTYDRSVSPRLNPTIEIAAVSPLSCDNPKNNSPR